jgi:hypothetical protein
MIQCRFARVHWIPSKKNAILSESIQSLTSLNLSEGNSWSSEGFRPKIRAQGTIRFGQLMKSRQG